MIQGKKYQGIGVDIWSAGVTLYAMLVGYLPFEDPDTIQLYKKISLGVYEEPDHLSAEARSVLKRILHTDPYNRASIQEIRQHSWVKKFSPLRTNNTSAVTLLDSSKQVNKTALVLSKKLPKGKKAGNITIDVKPPKLSINKLKIGLIDLTSLKTANTPQAKSPIKLVKNVVKLVRP